MNFEEIWDCKKKSLTEDKIHILFQNINSLIIEIFYIRTNFMSLAAARKLGSFFIKGRKRIEIEKVC